MSNTANSRRRRYLLVALALALVVLLAIGFNPSFQKKILLDRIEPYVDSARIEYVHLTPWSLSMENAAVEYQGGIFELDNADVRFGLLSLILRKLKVRQLHLQGVRLNLDQFQSPDEAPALDESVAAPFPGLLASLDRGFGYVLDQVAIDATVRLPGEKTVAAQIAGGGIAPDTTGALDLDLRFDSGDAAEHVDVDGEIRIEQLRRGRFGAIACDLTILVRLPSLPQSETAVVRLAISPAAPEDSPSAEASPDTDRPRLTPEAIQLSLRSLTAAGGDRATLTLDGIYNGNDGGFAGAYRVTASETLVQPYAAGRVIAPIDQQLSGALSANLVSQTGDLTITSDLKVGQLRPTYGNEQLPGRLRLENNLRLSLLPGRQLRIERLDTGLSDDDNVHSLNSVLSSDLTIALDDAAAALRQDNTLLTFELPMVPLAWFDLFVPGYDIARGSLSGAFVVATDSSGALHIKPQRPLAISGLTIKKAGEPVFEGLNVAVLPRATYAPDGLRVSLDELRLDAGGPALLTGAINADLPFSDDRAPDLNVSVASQLNLHRLADFLGIDYAGIPSLPEQFSLDFRAAARQRPGSRVIHRLDANLATNAGERLVRLELLQPIVIEDRANGSTIVNPKGDLVTFNVSDIPLNWFSVFVPGGALDGHLRRADFTLAMEDNGVARFAPSAPFRMDGVTVDLGDGPLLNDVGLAVSPRLRLADGSVDIDYQDLEVTSANVKLIVGGGRLGLGRAPTDPLIAEGRIEVDLQALAKQPLVAVRLPAKVSAAARLRADYRLSRDQEGVDIERLVADLFYDDLQPGVSLRASPPGIRVRTQLGGERAVAASTRGELVLNVTNLTPGPFTQILRATGLGFDTADGDVVLTSDGQSMNLRTPRPFTMTGIDVRSSGARLLQPFDLSLDTRMSVEGNALTVDVESYRMVFDRQSTTPAIDGSAQLVLDGAGNAVRLSSLDANMQLDLPSLLRQPVAMPGHSLTAGEVRARVSLAPNGRLESSVSVGGLKARNALPLEALEASLSGTRSADGRIQATTGVTTRGKSGVSDVALEVLAEDGSLDLDVNSSVFYLNDLLGSLNAITGKAPPAGAAAADSPAANPQPAISQQPDDRAFWAGGDRQVRLAVTMGRLFYTDYLEITGISASAGMLRERLSLERFTAKFHDSAIAADGVLAFAPGPTPYDLNLNASVEQLDLAQFLRELQPGAKPRAEGLFDMRVTAFGQSPNMPQYRNALFFDMNVQSRDGLFRLLNPDNPVVVGSTGLASAVGEVVSYVPTGLFGLGAVPRLVNYIKDVDYDRVDVQLVRDQSRDVRIRRFVVQSPQVLMTATGGVTYQPGVDILDSPLVLDATLNMRGEGAAIMYDMDLLQRQQDAWGYWKGPQVQFRGTLGVMESNLGDTISQAGKGMVVGGVSRPLSGLIGNFRHRWLDEGKDPLDYDAVPADDTVQDQPGPEAPPAGK